MQTSLTRLTLAEAAGQVERRQLSPVELTRSCLAQIERYNPTVNAFITVTAESALAEAEAAEREIQGGGWRGPLHGIPIAMKDLIDQKDVPTTAASAALKDNIAEEDAAVARRLRQAGAILLGKLNLHEFAYGGSGIIGHFGSARNPWDTSRITGGSSSGSAVAVATGMCFAALGTDTAGSIRLPAAYCGVVGLKPSFGLVSRDGVLPLSLSFDHVGPLARTVEDAAIVLDAIAGYDADDPGSRVFPRAAYREAVRCNPSAIRAGFADSYFCANLAAEIEPLWRAAVAQVGAMCASTVSNVDVPIDEDRTAHLCEAYHYYEQLIAERSEKFDPQTLNRLLAGKDITQAQYREACDRLEQLRSRSKEIFRQVDVLITPTSPVLPPLVADLQAVMPELRKRELVMLRNTRPFNVLGLPTITVPCGFTSEGLPVGMQISAAIGGEEKILAVAHHFEAATEWHRRVPPVLMP